MANGAAIILKGILRAKDVDINLPRETIYKIKMPWKFLAFTCGEYIFVNNLLWKSYDELGRIIRHERQHAEQFRRYGWGGIGFIVRYAVAQIVYGYAANPFEMEARFAEINAPR